MKPRADEAPMLEELSCDAGACFWGSGVEIEEFEGARPLQPYIYIHTH